MKATPILTLDGSFTLTNNAFGECYHSTRGAVTEAKEVYVQAGLDYYALLNPQTVPVRIFEMGFGAGLNAWVTHQYAQAQKVSVRYTAIEKYPLSLEEVAPLGHALDPSFGLLHQSPWEESVPVSDYFTLCKIQTDILHYVHDGKIDVLYFDPFSPNVQPDLWSAEVFANLYRCMSPGAVLVTYSAKGSVKQALRAVGFQVQRLQGSGGKRHMLRAVRPKV